MKNKTNDWFHGFILDSEILSEFTAIAWRHQAITWTSID